MSSAPVSLASRLAIAGAALAMLAASVDLALAQSSVTVYPRSKIDRGPPPDFQTYPLWERIFGFGGMIYPDYVSPDNGAKHPAQLAYLTGGGEGNLVFAAATVDRLCQMEQAPEITVLDPPEGGRLSFDLGHFTATRPDGGSHYCLGRQVEGWRVTYRGRPPRGGTSATLRVAYPHKGLSYTHVVAIPAR